jgi:hypothetical protein
MIEPPRPIDLPLDGSDGHRLVEPVRYPILFIDYILDARATKRSDVERLATRRRIKRCAIEISDQSAFLNLDDIPLKLAHIAVPIVKTFRHFTLP